MLRPPIFFLKSDTRKITIRTTPQKTPRNLKPKRKQGRHLYIASNVWRKARGTRPSANPSKSEGRIYANPKKGICMRRGNAPPNPEKSLIAFGKTPVLPFVFFPVERQTGAVIVRVRFGQSDQIRIGLILNFENVF